jgi:F-type H+-transporting ATPase subunit epsilon
MTIQCDIVTQERTVFSEAVSYISLPGANGVMGVLPNHTALLTTLQFGEVMVRNPAGEEQYFAIGGGFAEVQPDRVVILADSAEQAEEIDLERAESARERAVEEMSSGLVSDDPDTYAQIQASLMRARIRLNVGRRHAGRRRREMTPGVQQIARDQDEE